jgi:hypothetical protein
LSRVSQQLPAPNQTEPPDARIRPSSRRESRRPQGATRLQGDSGFSFADLSADLAGIAFAQRVLDTPEQLARVEKAFTVADYALSPKGLPEGLSEKEFARQYGSVSDKRFLTPFEDLRRRVRALPGYKGGDKSGTG